MSKLVWNPLTGNFDLSGSSAAPVAGANTTLSNLTSPTDINQDLLPDSDGGRDIGNDGLIWGNVLSYLIKSEETEYYDTTNTTVVGRTQVNNGAESADLTLLQLDVSSGVAKTYGLVIGAGGTSTKPIKIQADSTSYIEHDAGSYVFNGNGQLQPILPEADNSLNIGATDKKISEIYTWGTNGYNFSVKDWDFGPTGALLGNFAPNEGINGITGSVGLVAHGTADGATPDYGLVIGTDNLVNGGILIGTDNKTAGDSAGISLHTGTSTFASALTGNFDIVVGAASGSEGQGGYISFTSGNSNNSSGLGGEIDIIAGANSGTGNGPYCAIYAGAATGGGDAGTLDLWGGDAVNGGNGGDANLNAGSASGTGNGNGGNVNIISGTGNGSGIKGEILFENGIMKTSTQLSYNFSSANQYGVVLNSTVTNDDGKLMHYGSTDVSTDIYTNDTALVTGSNTTTNSTQDTGSINSSTGDITHAGASGNTGSWQAFTGANAGSGDSGPLTLQTGTSTSGSSGNILLTTGAAGVTRGYIQFSALVAVLPTGTANPSTSYPDGSCYYNTSDNTLRILNGGTWRSVVLI